MTLPRIDEATWHRLRLRAWRRGSTPRRRYIVAGAVVVLLHLLFGLVIRHTMYVPDRAGSALPPRRGDAIEIELIAPVKKPKAPPAMPSVSTPAQARKSLPPPRHPPHQQSANDSMQVVEHDGPASSSSVPAPKLFNPDGSAATAAPAPPHTAAMPDYVSHLPSGDTQIMRDQNPVAYKSTRFDANYGKEGAIERALDKAVNKTTVSHTFHPLPGVRIHCALSLLALAGGCGGDPPAPPSAKDGDQRLNMAPANPVVRGVQPPKAPSVDECVAIYRAGQPLPQGCPVDTPSRTTATEIRDCVAKYRSYKVLAPGCPNDATIKQAAQQDAAQDQGH